MGTHRQKEEDKETADLVAEYLANGGTVTKVKTRSMDHALGISNVTWGKKLTKTERKAKEAPIEEKEKKND